jgi:hypothetical protein
MGEVSWKRGSSVNIAAMYPHPAQEYSKKKKIFHHKKPYVRIINVMSQ